MKKSMFLLTVVFLTTIFAGTANSNNVQNDKGYSFVQDNDQGSPVLLAQNTSGDTALEKDATINQVIPKKETAPLPEPGANVWSWLKWVFLALGGFTTVRVLFFRLIPTSSNIDFWEKIFWAIEYILGGFITNKRKGGGTF